MNRDEGSGHRRIAWQEEWPSFFECSGESVANRIDSEIRTIVSDSDNDRSFPSFG